MTKILHLTLKKKWFDLIASGEKKKEYRECKPYWEKRLFYPDESPRHFDIVRFKNGYQKDAPVIDVEFNGFMFTNPEFCNPEHGEVLTGNTIVIKLGKIIKRGNDEKK